MGPLLVATLLLCSAVPSAAAAGDRATPSDGELKGTATPWCENSLRLRLQPDPLPAAAVQTKAAQSALLKQRGLAEMPSALLLGNPDGCKPGAPGELSPWAGGQRHGAVLWSSDILSSFGNSNQSGRMVGTPRAVTLKDSLAM